MVMSGGIYVPPMTCVERCRAAAEPGGDTVPARDAPACRDEPLRSRRAAARAAQLRPSLGLTPRQTDVLALLLQGKPNKLIARELNLSVETVKDHVAAVLRALGVSSRTQAVLAVSQMTQPGRRLAGAGGTPTLSARDRSATRTTGVACGR